MISIQLIAVFLLIARLVSVSFILIVLRLQWRLFGTKIDFGLVPNLTSFEKKQVYLARKVLFILAVAVFLGNMVPIVIDSITIFNDNLGRPSQLQAISVAYATSNALTAMCSAILVWALYRIAGLTATDDSK
jgi:cytochrome b561